MGASEHSIAVVLLVQTTFAKLLRETIVTLTLLEQSYSLQGWPAVYSLLGLPCNSRPGAAALLHLLRCASSGADPQEAPCGPRRPQETPGRPRRSQEASEHNIAVVLQQSNAGRKADTILCGLGGKSYCLWVG